MGQGSSGRAVAVAIALAGAVAGVQAGQVEIRRTADGIPHVRAGDWQDLGVGVGHVQAEDALCTLAEAFVTFQGRRSRFFGPDARPAQAASFGQWKNVDLDVFFKTFADDAAVARHRAAQPRELDQLITGFADGYNRRLREVLGRTGTRPACLGEPWVREIGADDVYRRLIAATLAAGYARFVPDIANARPSASPPADAAASDLGTRLAHRVGDQAALGSNLIAFGGDATGGDGGVLFGNPHWYWGGPDRFYQMHLTLPGQLDVAGVAFLGVPVVMIGFNASVAWTHTVSEARRFGLFGLTLDPADPTRYLVDGVSEPMTRRDVTVELPDGASVTRTLYRTRFGPVVDLGGQHPAYGWGRASAVAVRDVNEDNLRAFRTFFAWNRAGSLDTFIAAQRRDAAMPWVNTAAIGRGDARAWYADIGAVPGVPDRLRADCTPPLGRGFAALDAAVPFLDGSRSACDWATLPGAVQPKALPPDAMPSLLRRDYVANMNDSHWLTNVQAPLTGYAAVFGGEGRPLSLRGRAGHLMAASLADGGAGSSNQLAGRVTRAVLRAEAHSATLYKDTLLDVACRDRPATHEACAVLQRWSNDAGADDRGALLWDMFWARVQATAAPAAPPAAGDADPMAAPPAPAVDAPTAAKALDDAVAGLNAQGVGLADRTGTWRRVASGGRPWPLFGGCHAAGYFTIACNGDGTQAMGPGSVGNTYLQVVRFGAQGVDARTLLAHGQRETAVTGGEGAAPIARYARQDWLRFPFAERDIARDPALTRRVLRW